MSVQELLDKLNLAIERGWVNKDDIVFATISDNNYPIEYICANSVQVYDFNITKNGSVELEDWKNNDAINLISVRKDVK